MRINVNGRHPLFPFGVYNESKLYLLWFFYSTMPGTKKLCIPKTSSSFVWDAGEVLSVCSRDSLYIMAKMEPLRSLKRNCSMVRSSCISIKRSLELTWTLRSQRYTAVGRTINSGSHHEFVVDHSRSLHYSGLTHLPIPSFQLLGIITSRFLLVFFFWNFSVISNFNSDGLQGCTIR